MTANLRRQRDRMNVDDRLSAYDPKSGEPDSEPEIATAGSLPSQLAAAAGNVTGAAPRASAHAARTRPIESETVSPGIDATGSQLWRATVRMDQQLFPSWIVSTAVTQPGSFARQEAAARSAQFVGDPEGLVGVMIVSPRANAGVRITVDVSDVARVSDYACGLPQAGALYAVFPKVRYDYERLLQVRQQRPVDVTVRVEIDGAPAGEAVETCTLRSVNDCPFRLAVGASVWDVGYMFAAYVNESHPWIDGLLRDALQQGIVKHFDGIQSGQADSIVAQVYAIWSVLRRRGVRYSSVATTPGREGGGVLSQHVRFFEDSLSNAQANCVDGSVLLASVLRKIGLEPYLVYVPNHMYLAFALAELHQKVGDSMVRSTNLFGLETTAIGIENASATAVWSASPASCSVTRPLPWLGSGDVGHPNPYEFAPASAPISEAGVGRFATLDLADWRNFLFALERGTIDLGSGYVDRQGKSRDLQILRVSDARQAGLMPLGSQLTTGAPGPADRARVDGD